MWIDSIGEEFFIKSLDVEKVFEIVEKTDYLFLYNIKKCMEKSDLEDGVYLANLASEMNLSIPDTSRAVKKLQEKGYVSWMLDENKEKTYIALTKNAVEMSERQKEKIASAYEKIVSEISKEDLETTVRTLASISKMIGTGN